MALATPRYLEAAGIQDNVRPIFEIARLDQVFRIFPDVDTALAA